MQSTSHNLIHGDCLEQSTAQRPVGRIQLGLIYKITNKANGKIYIGQTVLSMKRRWKQHLYAAKAGSKSTLHKAIRKYGDDGFTVEVLAETPAPFLSDLERMFIRLFASRLEQHGYNMTEGGEGTRGIKISEPTRKKIIARLTGRPVSEATRQKHRDRQTGFVYPIESRKKMSESHIGKPNVERLSICPTCGVTARGCNLVRFHGDGAKG